MEINNLQVSNAYTANNSATPPVDNTLVQNQNKEAAQSNLNQENTRAAQQAFEVSITPEARDLMAATEAPPVQTEPQAQGTPQDQSPVQDQNPAQDQNPVQTQNAAQILNIVA